MAGRRLDHPTVGKRHSNNLLAWRRGSVADQQNGSGNSSLTVIPSLLCFPFD
jgi:hypothetical protein